jgi:hypothetical protein
MPATDPLGNRCDRIIRIHLRQLQVVEFDIHKSIRCAQRIYGRYGIFFQVASFEGLHLSPDLNRRLSAVATDCVHDTSSPEQTEIYERYGVQDLSSITAFLVYALHRPGTNSQSLGCGAYSPHRPNVFVSNAANPWVLAHEVAHVLLSDSPAAGHSNGPLDLMREGSVRTATDVDPVFSMNQIYFLRQSRHCLPC